MAIGGALDKKILKFVTPKEARGLMGRAYYGPEAGLRFFGTPSSRFDEGREVPFTAEQLIARRETHLLVAVHAFSIATIHGLIPTVFKMCEWEGPGRLSKYDFVQDYGLPGWHLVRKTPHPGTVGRHKFAGQLPLLLPNEVVPTARVMMYCIVAHFLTTDERLFSEDIDVRCGDIIPERMRSIIAEFTERDGISLHFHSDDEWDNDFGLASEVESGPDPLSRS